MKRILLLIMLLCSQFIYSETSTEDIKVTYRIEENIEAKSKTFIFTLNGLDIIRLYYVNNTFKKVEISEDLKTKDRIVTESYFMTFDGLPPKKLRKLHIEDKDGNFVKEYDESNIKASRDCKWVPDPKFSMGGYKCEYFFDRYNVGSYEEKDNKELYQNKKWSKLLNDSNLYKYKYFYATKMSFVNKEDIEVKNIKKDGNILEMTYVSKTTKDSKKETSYFVGTKDNKYMIVNKEDFIKDKILKYNNYIINYELCESYNPNGSDEFYLGCSKDLSITFGINEFYKLGDDQSWLISMLLGNGTKKLGIMYTMLKNSITEDIWLDEDYKEPKEGLKERLY